MIDQDKAKAIERANSYRQMMGLWAWKDFKSTLDGIRQEALEAAISAGDFASVSKQAGVARLIDRINSDLDYILNGADK